MKNKNVQKGFTLIEVMIVVAILGIISAIALPSYTKYVEKSRRTDAKVELLKIAQLQESFFAQNLSYAENLATLGLVGTTVFSGDGHYVVTMLAPQPAGCSAGGTACVTFEVTAEPPAKGAQYGDDACAGFKIDNVGRKEAKSKGGTYGDLAKAVECWGK